MSIMDQVAGIRQEAKAVREKFYSTRDEIEGNTRLSDDAKRDDVATEKSDTLNKLSALKEREFKVLDDRIQSLESSLHDVGGIGSHAIVAYRDAQDRAEQLEDNKQAQRLLDRAVKSRDEVLARAIFHTALEHSWVGTIKAFQEAYPAKAGASEELYELKQVRTKGAHNLLRSALYGPSI